MNAANSYRLRTNYLLIAAALALLPMIRLYYVGEEAIFPITSQEMWQQGLWLKQTLYGLNVQHNPLFNWLIIPIASLLGWEHVQEVARLLTIGATLGTAVILGWLTSRLYRDRAFAALTALTYLTFADVLLYHGWLAYVDPLFGFFIFAGIAALWIGCVEKRHALFWLSALLLTSALLSKAFTAYIFYGAAWLALVRRSQYRSVLLKPQALIPHIALLTAPILWFALLPNGSSQSSRMVDEIFAKLHLEHPGEYLLKLLTFPLEVWVGLLPASALALYFLRQRDTLADSESDPQHWHDALWMAGLNFLPYWLAPHGGVRYLIPIYPLLALIFARIIWQQGSPARSLAQRWMAVSTLLAYIAGFGLYPYYQHHFRGENYALAAADIVARTQGQPLYTSDVSASGLNVSAYVNKLRFPAQALQFPPVDLQDGYTLAREPLPAYGQVSQTYQLLGDRLHLMCKGSACSEKNNTIQP